MDSQFVGDRGSLDLNEILPSVKEETENIQNEKRLSNAQADKSASAKQQNEFVRKIYSILEGGEYPEIVTWTEAGDSFVVVDTGKFTSQILPNHFKHSNFASFVRQLNKYDFHKVKRTQEERKVWQYGELSWEFKHPLFKRGQEENLDNIKRKIGTQKKPTDRSLVLKNTEGQEYVLDTEASMNLLKKKTVSIDAFNKVKKKVDFLTRDLEDNNKRYSQLNGEFEKLNNKYYTVLESLLTFKTANDTLVNKFNTLCTSIADQGIKLPDMIQFSVNSPQRELELTTSGISNPQSVHNEINLGENSDDPLPIHKANKTPSISDLPNPILENDENINTIDGDLAQGDTILKKGFNVLLVEDDEVSIQLCSKFLIKYGCTVQVVTDGLAAISTLEKYRFDLVLMDIVMPNLDGATATSIIRNFDNETPIIAMTGSIEHQDLITYLQHGMNDILAKPFTRRDLYSMLTRYLKNRVPLSQQVNIPADVVHKQLKPGSSNLESPLILDDMPPLKKSKI
ncbi:hypothetical protein TPHA_0C00150 [Tetrapisispora phaffii CBS 4417]|uniref:Transcription factor n=1 Tax=Tetrapisispora phaffii (strain ATCC 24235 / CBS 4417 / NBRC 1672 / NRRL Y-8282 / UCD 70-5) TaxID=1071381 RepID=G8BQZ6_TETPH|nr:hypothetical protein TPHA_0C00150 [Tetrapisispora phaffii CBS 4417]CCE62172.1 hypothetical protein TPHA_0C00150 [Tetrapisispora phaffii CBS 4417]